MKMHSGIDIAAPKGTPIQVAGDGVVKFAGRQKGYGNVVIVEHADGKETFYAHADKIFVQEGQTVGVGTMIATVGSTGKSTGPHLHFEVRQNNQPVDPSKYLSKVLSRNADK
jgi:murein DD-endopeptidase MepM/ murein hydrolase activator NlpD